MATAPPDPTARPTGYLSRRRWERLISRAVTELETTELNRAASMGPVRSPSRGRSGTRTATTVASAKELTRASGAPPRNHVDPQGSGYPAPSDMGVNDCGTGELGALLRAGSHRELRGWLRWLGETDHPRSFLAEIALGHGVLATSPSAMPDGVLSMIEGLPVDRAA